MKSGLICILATTSFAPAAISFTWREEDGDVLARVDGSIIVPPTLLFQNNKSHWKDYTMMSLGIADDVSRGFNVFNHDDARGVPGIPREDGVTPFSNEEDRIGFSYFFSNFTGTLDQEFAITMENLYIDSAFEAGDVFAPSGELRFENTSFNQLFGTGTSPQDFLRISNGGAALVVSQAVPEPSSGTVIVLAGLLALSRRARACG